ncbi:REP element-mobilizing transposase RayT [Vreelandella subterranea]|uniref:REP element-mobilizing transposase RayT n=1 Tax=Vreelandella subterranea TaxID=416874 RepID=A0A1H9WLZ0_9GAMM|nr:REP element-mobilizing transposase RayT [Halomonas subterranea]
MPRGHALRLGRRCIPGHYYVVTIVTENRRHVFRDFSMGCAASRAFYHPSVQRHGVTWAFVVMPDHVHWLMALEGDLSQAVKLYKSYVSLAAGSPVWQRGFHDRLIRQEEGIRDSARYIVANPLRAGLVNQIGDYSFWDARWLTPNADDPVIV